MQYNTTTDIAKQYRDWGFSVIPIKLDGSKQPKVSWKPYTEKFASDQELEAWFSGSDSGIGVIAGPVSGNLTVIDFDHDAEQVFNLFWSEIQTRIPWVIDKLVVVSTPRPGKHVWFRQISSPVGAEVLARTEPLAFQVFSDEVVVTTETPNSQPRVLIETRGTNSYVIGVGSPPAAHPTGKAYKQVHGDFGQLPQLSDEEVQVLFEICRSFNRNLAEKSTQPQGESYRGEPRPGDVFDEHEDLLPLLLNAGWQVYGPPVEEVVRLTRPGKEDPGTSATLGHHKDANGRPLLHVFSSNAAPFEENHTYDAFAVFALLYHNGDFSKAAVEASLKYAKELNAAKVSFHKAIADKVASVSFKMEYQPFPVECLPEIVRRYVCEHAAAIGIDNSYVAAPMLSVLASLIGDSRVIVLKNGYTEPAIIWTVTVGIVSSGKSPGWQAAIRPVQGIENSITEAIGAANQQFKHSLSEFKAAKAEGSKGGIKPTEPENRQQVLVNDATMEALIDVMKDNPKLLLAVDEAAGWVKSMNAYRQGRDVENWLSMYDGRGISVNRKKDNYRVSLPRTSVSVTGTIQPGVASEVLQTEQFIGNGFAARILSVQPPPSIVRWNEVEVDPHLNQEMEEFAKRLYLLSGEPCGSGSRPVHLTCTVEAKQAFREWMNDTATQAEKMETGLQNGWLKLRPIAARFALVFSVCNQLAADPGGSAMQPVDLASMQAGIQIARWFARELERNYNPKQNNLKDHLSWILSKHPGGVDARTLQTGRRNIETADKAREVIQQLVQMNCGRLEGNCFIPYF